MKNKFLVALAATSCLASLHANAAPSQQSLQNKIDLLEERLEKIENKSSSKISQTAREVYGNSFNPSIGIVLNGKYQAFSESEAETISGFAFGEEGARGDEGIAIDESELNFSGNIDDKFFASMTAAIVREDGEDKIELEAAYVQTQPGLLALDGLSLKFGRAFWKLGYLNEQHAHADDFADRPLPYRVFLNKSYNDDGAELSYVLPTNFYSEIGGGVFAGDDAPFGNANGDNISNWSAYARIGSDIGSRQNWRLGAYVLSGQTGDSGRVSNEDNITFIGETKLYVADLRYIWAPTGNNRQQEVLLQADYFHRDDDGTYADAAASTCNVLFDE